MSVSTLPQAPSSGAEPSAPPVLLARLREPLLVRLFRRLDDNLAEL